MAVFLTGAELNDQILTIIQSAKHRLCLISPYIKLHEIYFGALRQRVNDSTLQTTIIFRESKYNPLINILDRDLNLFKQFENIHIRIHKDLHGKFYGNEAGFLVTSMNLYEYSQKNNFEFGIYFPTDARSESKSETDLRDKAKKTIAHVFSKSTPIMSNRPNPVNELFEVEAALRHFDFIGTNTGNSTIQPDKLNTVPEQGFCIRTGKQIPFNIAKPYSYRAYQAWAKEKKPIRPEKYCHLTGEPTMDEVSFERPIAYHNWTSLSEQLRKEIRNRVAVKITP